jgi:hypothetical protein
MFERDVLRAVLNTPESIDDSLPTRPFPPSDKYLEGLWRHKVETDPITTLHDSLKARFTDDSINGGDVANALRFLAQATGDVVFQTAARAMRGCGLISGNTDGGNLRGGGLKQDVLRVLRQLNGEAEWIVMPHMRTWIVARGLSMHAAAMRTAAVYGIPGASFATVVKNLERTYRQWSASVAANKPATPAPNGDTGRRLRVRFARPWLDINNVPVNEHLGVKFDGDGFGIAPDTGEWRRLIDDGHIALYGEAK